MTIFTKIRGTSPALDRVQDAIGVSFRRAQETRSPPANARPALGVNRISGALIVERYVIEAGATANLDYPFPGGREIVDVWLKKTAAAGGGAGTIRVQTMSGDAITNAMSIDVADQTIVRAATVNDARDRVQENKIRFARTRTASADESCIAYIVTMPVT